MAAAAALAQLDSLLQPEAQFQGSTERLVELVAELRRGPAEALAEVLRRVLRAASVPFCDRQYTWSKS